MTSIVIRGRKNPVFTLYKNTLTFTSFTSFVPDVADIFPQIVACPSENIISPHTKIKPACHNIILKHVINKKKKKKKNLIK